MATLVSIAGGDATGLLDRSDDELMRLSAAGRADAFAALVGRHARKLTGFCGKLVGDSRIGEEIAQDCWLSVWATRGSYRSDGQFAVFLYTVARNRCRNHARDKTRRSKLIDPVAQVSEKTSTSPAHLDELLVQDRRRRVYAAIDRLPEALREVVLLRVSEELDYPAIARIVGRTESAVRSRVHFALRELRECLKEDRS